MSDLLHLLRMMGMRLWPAALVCKSCIKGLLTLQIEQTVFATWSNDANGM